IVNLTDADHARGGVGTSEDRGVGEVVGVGTELDPHFFLDPEALEQREVHRSGDFSANAGQHATEGAKRVRRRLDEGYGLTRVRAVLAYAGGVQRAGIEPLLVGTVV